MEMEMATTFKMLATQTIIKGDRWFLKISVIGSISTKYLLRVKCRKTRSADLRMIRRCDTPQNYIGRLLNLRSGLFFCGFNSPKVSSVFLKILDLERLLNTEKKWTVSWWGLFNATIFVKRYWQSIEVLYRHFLDMWRGEEEALLLIDIIYFNHAQFNGFN